MGWASAAFALPLLSAPSSLTVPTGVTVPFTITNVSGGTVTFESTSFNLVTPVFASGQFGNGSQPDTCLGQVVLAPGASCAFYVQYLELSPGQNSGTGSAIVSFVPDLLQPQPETLNFTLYHPADNPVPTLSEFGIYTLMVMLVLGAGFALRRNRGNA